MFNWILTTIGLFLVWQFICYLVRIFSTHENSDTGTLMVGAAVEGVFTALSVRKTKHFNYYNVLTDQKKRIFKCFTDTKRLQEGNAYFISARIKGYNAVGGLKGAHLHMVRIVGLMIKGEPQPQGQADHDDACLYWQGKAITLEESGRIPEAMSLYEKCVRSKDKRFAPYDHLSQLYHSLQLYDDEERILKDALENTDDEPDVKHAKFSEYTARIQELKRIEVIQAATNKQQYEDSKGSAEPDEDSDDFFVEDAELTPAERTARAIQAHLNQTDAPPEDEEWRPDEIERRVQEKISQLNQAEANNAVAMPDESQPHG